MPCRHNFPADRVEETKSLLFDLPNRAPELFEATDVPVAEWPVYLRAAVESLRGSWAASTTDKYRFLEAIFEYGVTREVFESWEEVTAQGRNDFRVILTDGTAVSIEAKGCPDGNNTAIWDRPAWADEFVVWCQCPDSFTLQPGVGIWSGIATRLASKCVAEGVMVDAMIFFDARCGTPVRPCPKDFGVTGALRSAATTNASQRDKPNWMPPPCIYLFPQSLPSPGRNQNPIVHSPSSLHFCRAILDLFQVPRAAQSEYVHDAVIGARANDSGTEIRVAITSRSWPDRTSHVYRGAWKPLRREGHRR